MDDGKKDNNTNSRTKLLNFIDTKILKDILDAFTETTGLMANIVDIDGKSIFSRKDLSKCCRFCKLIYNTQHGLERCRGAYKRAGKQAAMFGEPYIFRCPSGLIEWASPIIVEGEHLGTIICGQVLMWQPEEFFWIELREMNQELTSDFTELFQAVEELPVVSASMVRSASYLMYIVANYIMKSGWENYIHTKEIIYQQSLLHEEIENRKNLENKLPKPALEYNISIESDLTTKIKLGEEKAARELFQRLLTDIVLYSNNQTAIVQTKVIELCVIISRSAVSVGIPMEVAGEENTKIFQEIYHETTPEGICVVGQKLLDFFLEQVQKTNQKPYHSRIQEIQRYIQNNFNRNLTLEEIAQSVYLSPSYASRLFKKVQNMSLMEYLTRVRIEEAKRLLHNPQYLIDEIAENIGYDDASYFTKVFKRYEGVTPTQYRKTLQKA